MGKLLIIVTVLLPILNLYSQDMDISILSEVEVYTLIDEAIEERDENLILFLGANGSDFPDYDKFEIYILEKAAKLIQHSDLGFPQKLIEAVLYNDLENSHAQELYSIVINKKIENEERLEVEKLAIKRNRAELVELNDDINEEIIYQEYMSNIIGNNVEFIGIIDSYSDSFNRIHYISSSYFYPCITNFYTSEVYDDFVSRDPHVNSYSGQGMDLGLGAKLRYLTFRTDIFLNITYDDLIYEVTKQVSGSANISIGLSTIKVPLFLRAGFLYNVYLYNGGVASDVAITNLPTPSVGLGLNGLKFLKVLKLDLITDILLAPFYTENFDSGFSGKVYLTVNLFGSSANRIEIKGGFDVLFLVEGGLSEYSITPRLGFGISSYE